MFKILSAAVVAASVMVAPAMAATVIKTERTVTTSHVLAPSVANAHAKVVVVKKHHRHVRPHHRVVKKRVIVKHPRYHTHRFH
ncbi:His-rich protein BRANT [Afipia carboxidovorans]|uniref:His-rich protein BRANT n=1 Tax=Afipia carboxidovorans TaxID=40137 RepID=UPI00308F5E9C|nr:hypothetical protein CRBSH125_06250 [Afipia carboxidovorans]